MENVVMERLLKLLLIVSVVAYAAFSGYGVGFMVGNVSKTKFQHINTGEK